MFINIKETPWQITPEPKPPFMKIYRQYRIKALYPLDTHICGQIFAVGALPLWNHVSHWTGGKGQCKTQKWQWTLACQESHRSNPRSIQWFYKAPHVTVIKIKGHILHRIWNFLTNPLPLSLLQYTAIHFYRTSHPKTLMNYNYHTSSPVIYVLVIFTDANITDVPVFWDTIPCKLVYR